MQSRNSKDFIKYLLSLLLYGSNGIVVSHLALSSGEIVLLRSSIGAASLLVIFLVTGHRFTAWRHKRDFLMVILSGVTMAADWLLLFEAYKQIGVSLSIVINYCGPAMVILASAILFKDRLTVGKLVALGAALFGAVLINGVALEGEISLFGLVCAVLSAISYAAMILFNKQSKSIVGMENAVVQLLSGAATVIVYLLVTGGLVFEIPADNWPWILWLGLLNTGFGCFLYFSSIGRLPVQTVAICGYLEPLVAVVLSAVFLHETMLPVQWLGAALIIGGAVVGECLSRRGPKVTKQ